MVGIFLLAIAFILVMMLATGVMVSVVEEWVNSQKKKKIFLTTILLALIAAAPEIAIAIAASLEGKPLMALGNAVGANLANLGLVVGGLVAIVGVVPVVGEYAKGSLWITFTLSLLPFMLMSDGSLSRFDGVVLIFGYLLYLNYVIKSNRIELKQAKIHRSSSLNKSGEMISLGVASALMFVIGGTTLLICSTFLIKLVSNISLNIGVSNFWIGLVFLAIATTIPELIVGWWNHKKRESLLTMEKLLGSIITNSTLVVGLLALINPVIVPDSLSKGVAGLFLVFILGLFWLFTKSKRKIERWEGVVLMGVYLMFLGLQMLFIR